MTADTLLTGPRQLLEFLDRLGIETHTVEHPPVFTVAESRAVRGSLPGGHCKSLFLRDKKRRLWLVVMLEHRHVELKKLRRLIGARAGLSFASEELLREALGVTPGAVTPFALINDGAHRVSVVLDRAMLDHEMLNYHPLVNTMSTSIRPRDLLRFIGACGHRPLVVDLDAGEKSELPG